MERINYNNTIPFVPPISVGKVVKVHAGNHLSVASSICCFPSYYRFPIHIRGIRCPEKRTSSSTEKRCAFMARDLVRAKVADRIISIENIDIERYGRIIADIFVDGVELKRFLLEEHLAVPEHETPDDWLEYYNQRPKH